MTVPAIRDERLTPAPMLEIATLLTNKLFLAFNMQGPDDDGQRKALLVIYVEALSKYPLWAIEEAVQRFIRGEIKSNKKGYAPKPDQLCEVVRDVLEPVQREVLAAEQVARRRETERRPAIEQTPESKHRMQVKMLVLSKLGPEVARQCMETGKFMPYIDALVAANIPVPDAPLVERPDEIEELP